ncbi:M16 family metallopeptidase [Pedobacter sp. AW31-3R]|uniref:M16 family metallopeptidase n=1 Tax=Pedobacter sp. AW31-3R TaxID=3445781 RepID=UPI003FA0F9E8
MKIKICWKNVIPVLLVGLGTALSTRAQQPLPQSSAGQENLPLDSAVRTGKLPNGFTYYIRKNQEPKNKVVMYLVNKVGSILENDDQQGLAHFLEHMSFNGTVHYPGKSMVDFLEKTGVRFGADLNAYTSFDETVYQLPFPIENAAMLKDGLQVMRDWAQEASLDPIEIDKERGVVLEEKRLGEGTKKKIMDLVFPVMTNGSRYASRSPIGTEEVIKNFKAHTLEDFYRTWYRPNLQALIVVGDIDVKQVETMVNTMFSDLKNPVNEKERLTYPIELKGKNQFTVFTDKEVPVTSIQVSVKHYRQAFSTFNDYREMVIRALFNQMAGARFASLAEKHTELYLNAGVGIAPLIANLDNFSASVSTRPGQLEKGFKAFWTEVMAIRNAGFSTAELDRAKKNYLSAMERAVSEKDHKSSAEYVQEYTRHFTVGESSPGIAMEYKLTKEFLAQISLATITELAKRTIANINRDVLIIAPENEKANLPGEERFASWFKTIENTQSLTFEDEDQTAPALLADVPKPGTIVSQKKIASLGVTELTLNNGVRVILKPTKFKKDEITFSAFSEGGTSLYANADIPSAASAAGIIAASGIRELSPVQLKNTLNGKQVSVSPFIGEMTEGLSGAANNADFETAMQMVYLYFTHPRADTAIFKNSMSRNRAAFINLVKSPEEEFADTINAVVTNGHSRRTGPSLEKLEQIDLYRALEIYRERFADASDFTFILTGSFEPDQIQPVLLKYIGGLPAIWRKEKSKDLGVGMRKGKLEKTIRSGTAEKATVKLMISGDYVVNDENNLQLHALKAILGFRLIERLREQEGGVYSPSVGLEITRKPIPYYAFTINFGCAPENVDKLITATREEIHKLQKEGVSADDIQKYVAEEKVSMEAALQTNAFWGSYLNAKYQNQEDPESILDYKENLNQLSSRVLQKAAVKYFNQRNFLRFVLLPVQSTSAKK